MNSKTFALTWLIGSAMFGAMGQSGCSSDKGQQVDGRAAPDGKATDGAVGDGSQQDLAAGPTLTGHVRDPEQTPIESAKIAVGEATTYSGADGSYRLKNLTSGEVEVAVTHDWFASQTFKTTVDASQTTVYDITLQEIPLKLAPEDAQLAASYNASFDWTKQKVSIVVVPSSTRKDLDNAIYWRNPAFYQPRTAQTKLEPTPAPAITSEGAVNFNFPLAQQKQALVASTIVDSFAATGLSAQAESNFLIWIPMTQWLIQWDAEQAQGLNAVGLAVKKQLWGCQGACPTEPQAIEKVYLEGGTLWVKVVFEDFVTLGQGISDTDQDQRKEIFAKIDPQQYSATLIDKLSNDYMKEKYKTYGLSQQLDELVTLLYSSTAMRLVDGQTIGKPYVIPEVGTIKYPFAVCEHAQKVINVLLVTP